MTVIENHHMHTNKISYLKYIRQLNERDIPTLLTPVPLLR